MFDLSDNIIILSGSTPDWGMLPLARKDDLYIEMSPSSNRKALDFCEKKGFQPIATSDNYYPDVKDKKAYEVLIGRSRTERSSSMHILDEWEYKEQVPWAPKEAVQNTYKISEQCEVKLPQAQMISFDS